MGRRKNLVVGTALMVALAGGLPIAAVTTFAVASEADEAPPLAIKSREWIENHIVVMEGPGAVTPNAPDVSDWTDVLARTGKTSELHAVEDGALPGRHAAA
jgi:hypothetical protein